MKPAPNPPPNRATRIARFLALWVACILVNVLHLHWLDVQDEGFWLNFGLAHMGYLGIAVNGAFNALLVLVVWRIGVSVTTSVHRWVVSTCRRTQRLS